jgi:GTPase SAR1 family protein
MDNFEEEEVSDEPNLLKIIVIGESEVGKSSLITRFIDKKFFLNNSSTVGMDFRIIKKLKLDSGKTY